VTGANEFGKDNVLDEFMTAIFANVKNKNVHFFEIGMEDKQERL
jgi:hypothetical protein